MSSVCGIFLFKFYYAGWKDYILLVWSLVNASDSGFMVVFVAIKKKRSGTKATWILAFCQSDKMMHLGILFTSRFPTLL